MGHQAKQVTFTYTHTHTGTLSVSNIHATQRTMPEPSFLFHWMSTHETKQMIPLFTKLLNTWPHLYNIQVG